MSFIVLTDYQHRPIVFQTNKIDAVKQTADQTWVYTTGNHGFLVQESVDEVLSLLHNEEKGESVHD